MKIKKLRLIQIIKEELIKEVSTLPRDEAICVGFMHKRSDELSETLPSYEGVIMGKILKHLKKEVPKSEKIPTQNNDKKLDPLRCYNLFVQTLQEIGAKFGDTWEETKEKFANSRYRNAREEWEQYKASQMVPKKAPDRIKRMGTAPTITQIRTNTRPLSQAPKPEKDPLRVKKFDPRIGKYRQ